MFAMVLMQPASAFAAVITVTQSGGTFSPVTRTNVQSAFAAASCGDEVQIEAGTVLRTGAAISRIDVAGGIATVTFNYNHDFSVGEYMRIVGFSGAGAGLNSYRKVAAIVSGTQVTTETGNAAADGTYTGDDTTAYVNNFLFPYDPFKKECAVGNEITITSTKKAWLPDAEMRITPSYKSLLPTFQMIGDSSNDPLFTIDDAVKGVKIVGVGFQKVGANIFTLARMIETGRTVPMSSAAQMPQRVTFDRILFYNDFVKGNSWRQAVNLRVNNVSFVNNFIDNFMSMPSDGETYVWATSTSIGPYNISNNYVCCAMAVPFMFGGNAPEFSTYTSPAGVVTKMMPSDMTLEHNTFYTSLKHYSFSPTYVGDAYRGDVKNCSELKVGLRGILRYNMCENSFSGEGSQWYGFLATSRANSYNGTGTCTLDAARTTVTCPGLTDTGMRAGVAIGLATGATSYQARYQWRNVLTADRINKVFTVDTPFDQIAAGSSVSFAYALTPWWTIQNTNIYGNYFKSVGTPIQVLGQDEIYPNTFTADLTYRNNLAVYTADMKESTQPVWNYAHMYVLSGGRNLKFFNNTAYNRPDFAVPIYGKNLRLESLGGVYGPTDQLQYIGNVHPTYYSGGGTNLGQQIASGEVTRANIQQNTFPVTYYLTQPCLDAMGQATSTCARNYMTGTYSPMFVNETANDFNIGAASPYKRDPVSGAKAEVGAKMESVAIIRYLNITRADNNSALAFSYKVPSFWAARACQLEVSLSRNLITDEGPYTVVDALRPDYFMRADSDKSNRHATRSADGVTRTFQVGASVQETDDTGVTRSIALNAASTYYYRLMCGGAVERGQF